MSNVKQCFKAHVHSSHVSAALLLLRIAVGAAFIQHGYGKILTPFSWMPAGSPVPGALQFLAALSEFGGGIALILGLLTPLASFGIACTMFVAVSMHAFVMKDPHVNLTGGSGFELPLTYLAIAVLLMCVGPGRYSADANVFGEKQ